MEIITINNLSNMILILINTGAVVRIIYCAIMMNNPECEQQMEKRIKNTIIFVVIANSLASIQAGIQHYWR